MHRVDVFEQGHGSRMVGTPFAPHRQRDAGATDQLAGLADEYMDVLVSWADLDSTAPRAQQQSRQQANTTDTANTALLGGHHGPQDRLSATTSTADSPPARARTSPTTVSRGFEWPFTAAGAVQATAAQVAHYPPVHVSATLDLKTQLEGATRTGAHDDDVDDFWQSLGLAPMGKAPGRSLSWSAPMADLDLALAHGLGEDSAAHSSARSSTVCGIGVTATAATTAATTAKRSASESQAYLDLFDTAVNNFGGSDRQRVTASSTASAASRNATPPRKRCHTASANAACSSVPASTAKLTTAAAAAQDIASLARLAKISKQTKGGFCLGCGMVKPLETRKSLLKQGKFAICNACRKTHLYRITAEMKAWEQVARSHLLASGLSSSDTLTVMRTALVQQWQDPRMSRIMNLALLADANHIAFSLLVDSNLNALRASVAGAAQQQQQKQQQLRLKTTGGEARASSADAIASFSHISVLGQVYHVGLHVVTGGCRETISTGIRQAVCAFLNEAMMMELAMPPGPMSLSFVLDAHGLVLTDLTPTDVQVLFAD